MPALESTSEPTRPGPGGQQLPVPDLLQPDMLSPLNSETPCRQVRTLHLPHEAQVRPGAGISGGRVFCLSGSGPADRWLLLWASRGPDLGRSAACEGIALSWGPGAGRLGSPQPPAVIPAAVGASARALVSVIAKMTGRARPRGRPAADLRDAQTIRLTKGRTPGWSRSWPGPASWRTYSQNFGHSWRRSQGATAMGIGSPAALRLIVDLVAGATYAVHCWPRGTGERHGTASAGDPK
jgi:hypothetical protein